MITITMMMKVMMMMMKIVSKGEPHSSLPHEPQALPFGHPGALQLLELNLFRWDPLPEFKAFKVFALFYILQFQTCHLTIASYGWTANDLIYLWKVKKGYLWNVTATKIWNLTNSFIGVSYMSLLDESVVLEQNKYTCSKRHHYKISLVKRASE